MNISRNINLLYIHFDQGEDFIKLSAYVMKIKYWLQYSPWINFRYWTEWNDVSFVLKHLILYTQNRFQITWEPWFISSSEESRLNNICGLLKQHFEVMYL